MIKQYKEVVATEEYIVAVYDNKSIDVYNRYDNAKGALREIADQYGFEYDQDWTTRQFGKKLIDAVGDGAKAIADDTYCVPKTVYVQYLTRTRLLTKIAGIHSNLGVK